VEPTLHVDVYEVKLGDAYLMSSLFTVSETQLAALALAALPDEPLDLLVGGLGLGYTAVAALADRRVRTLTIVEALRPVIDWHEHRLLPNAEHLVTDPRVRVIHADFFAAIASRNDLAADALGLFHAILVDIDHSPRHLLHPSHETFYAPTGLHDIAARLHPGGVFALWSDDPPDASFLADLRNEFTVATPHLVTFDNFLTDGTPSSTVYAATTKTA
jgi:spermidine synthase